MNALAGTFQTVHAALRGALAPDEAARRLGADATRLAYYVDAVKGHVRDLLEKNYPTLIALLGEDRFEALLEELLEQYPPDACELNENAGAFRDLLASAHRERRHGITELHLELAEVEWQELRAYFSTALLPDPGSLEGPALNPTLSILQLDYPVATFLHRWRTEGDPRPAPPQHSEPETVFILRDPESEQALVLRADDELLFAFKVAYDGLSPEEAAERAGLEPAQVRVILQEAADWGVILLPPPDMNHNYPMSQQARKRKP